MPVIYSQPANITAIGSLSATERSMITDNNPYTSYQSSGGLSVTYDGSADTAYVLADTVTATGAQDVGGGKQGAVITSSIANPFLIPATGKIYSVILMTKLLELNQEPNRAITRFDTSRTFRNTYVQEDLYGRRSLQQGHLGGTKRTIAYTIWKAGSNMREARNEVNELLRIANENPNITIWDLDEKATVRELQDPNMPESPTNMYVDKEKDILNNQEGVFGAYWVPDSFSESLQGLQVVSYSFAVTEM